MKAISKKFYNFLILIITLSVLSGCAPAKPPIKIAISAWAGVEPAELAAQLGFYEKRGVKVELKRFSTYSDSIDALRDGKTDAGMHTLDDTIRNISSGRDVRVVLLTDYSNGADGIVVRPGIKTLDDLKGKKIGAEIGTVGHFSLLKILNIVGLTPKDVTIVSIPAWEIQQNMINGAIDAGVTWEPFLSDTANKINGNILITSRDYPETIITTMTFDNDVIRQRPDDVQKITAAFFDAVEYMKNNPDDAYMRMGKAEGISADEFKATTQGVQFLDMQANSNLFSARDDGKIYLLTKDIAQFLFDQRIIQTLPAVDQILEPKFVRTLSAK